MPLGELAPPSGSLSRVGISVNGKGFLRYLRQATSHSPHALGIMLVHESSPNYRSSRSTWEAEIHLITLGLQVALLAVSVGCVWCTGWSVRPLAVSN